MAKYDLHLTKEKREMYVNLTTSFSSRKQLIILGAWAVELYSSVLVIDMKRHPYMRRSSATSPYSSNTPSSYQGPISAVPAATTWQGHQDSPRQRGNLLASGQ
jgi:hypothetical protein